MAGITLGSNIAALRGIRELDRTSNRLGVTFERLSSGQRINRASDDAAGLAISESLAKDVRVFSQGVRNFNDGLSALAIADSALGQLTTVVTRLQELAEQSANGTYSNEQRQALNTEAQALSEEYTRIIETTEFNSLKLFGGETEEIRLQGGFGVEGSLAIRIGIQSNQISATMVRGTGSFLAATRFDMEEAGTDGGSYSVAVGDLNGDGKLDLVTVGRVDEQGHATVRLGDGTGSFGNATTYAAETGSTQGTSNEVTLSDLDGDGNLDLLTAGMANNGNPAHTQATIRLGDGTSSFGSAMTYQGASGGVDAAQFRDIDHDGALDQVIAGYLGDITVRLGLGGGSFGAATTFAQTAQSLALADVNEDGTIDLVTTGTNEASIRLGDGAGSFGTAVTYLMANSDNTHGGVQIADIDNDGALDLIISSYHNIVRGEVVSIRLGDGSGSFGAETTFSNTGNGPRDLELGDVNGDGNLDLITSGYVQAGSFPGLVSIRIGDGTGSFGALTTYDTETGSNSATSNALVFADVNGDGVGKQSSSQSLLARHSQPPQFPAVARLDTWLSSNGRFLSTDLRGSEYGIHRVWRVLE